MAEIKVRSLAGKWWAVEKHGIFGRRGAYISRWSNRKCQEVKALNTAWLGSIEYGSFCVFDNADEAFSAADEIKAILGMKS